MHSYICTAAPGTLEAEVVDLFNKIETNKMGEISHEEFLAAVQPVVLFQYSFMNLVSFLSVSSAILVSCVTENSAVLKVPLF